MLSSCKNQILFHYCVKFEKWTYLVFTPSPTYNCTYYIIIPNIILKNTKLFPDNIYSFLNEIHLFLINPVFFCLITGKKMDNLKSSHLPSKYIAKTTTIVLLLYA